MKKYTIVLVILLSGLGTSAAIINVSVTSNQFSHANIPNVIVGDVIRFNFGGANFHNAISNPLGMVPAGAQAIFSGSPGGVTGSYSYTVTIAGSYRYYCELHSVDGVTGMVGTFTALDPVPVKLTNFNVVYSNKAVIARWQTVTEENVSHFSLLKSIDGDQYNEAGQLAAAGNSHTLQSYSLRDEVPGSSRYIYYMLKTVDLDGKTSLSEVKVVRNVDAAAKLITMMNPNPVRREEGHLMIQFNADRESVMKALVKDAVGKTVMNVKLNAFKGINNGHIHMADLPAGMYTIVFTLDGMREVKKVMVK